MAIAECDATINPVFDDKYCRVNMQRFKDDLGYTVGDYIYAVVQARNEKGYSIGSNPNAPAIRA